MESKLFLGAGTDSSSFEKAKTVFCISLQKIPVLGHVLGTADGPALCSFSLELNSHLQKSESVLENSSAKTADAQGGLRAPSFQSWTLKQWVLIAAKKQTSVKLLQLKTGCRL